MIGLGVLGACSYGALYDASDDEKVRLARMTEINELIISLPASFGLAQLRDIGLGCMSLS